MATPEIKHFAEALTALSNSAMGVAKDMDQRITASRKMAYNLNAITAHNKQIIDRQIRLVQALLEHNAAAEREMRIFQEELRSYSFGRDDTYSTAAPEQKSQSKANEFNLPPLRDVLDKIRTDRSDISHLRKSFSDSSLSYSRSRAAPRSQPTTAPIVLPSLKVESVSSLDHSPIKRRRPSVWDTTDDDNDLRSPASKPRYEAAAKT